MPHYDEQEEALRKKEKKYYPEEDMVLDFEVPEVEIQYQEDDGNSNCEGGGCTI